MIGQKINNFTVIETFTKPTKWEDVHYFKVKCNLESCSSTRVVKMLHIMNDLVKCCTDPDPDLPRPFIPQGTGYIRTKNDLTR